MLLSGLLSLSLGFPPCTGPGQGTSMTISSREENTITWVSATTAIRHIKKRPRTTNSPDSLRRAVRQGGHRRLARPDCGRIPHRTFSGTPSKGYLSTHAEKPNRCRLAFNYSSSIRYPLNGSQMLVAIMWLRWEACGSMGTGFPGREGGVKIGWWRPSQCVVCICI
jgi:hypothetical protein